MKIKTDEELWEILGTRDKFNDYINLVVDLTCRKIMLAVPALVIHHIKNEQAYMKIKDNFFKLNPELINHQEILGQTLNEVSSEHSDYEIEKIFHLAGIEVKKKIRDLEENKNA